MLVLSTLRLAAIRRWSALAPSGARQIAARARIAMQDGMKFVASFLALLSVTAVAQEPLVLVVGGYQTCAKSVVFNPLPSTKIQEMAAKAHVAFGANAKYLYICYSGLHAFDLKTIEVQFDSDVNFAQPNHFFVNFDALDGDKFLRPIFGWVLRQVEEAGNPEIFLAGHSYGGWTSLRIARMLLARGKNVRGLEMIDPINPLFCPAPVYAKSTVLNKILGKDESVSGCTRSPGAMPPAVAKGLAKNQGWWHDTYQTRHPTLHSGPIYSTEAIDEKSGNSEYLFGEAKRDFHRIIATDAGVWDGIGARYFRNR
jgi:hypothetical protein